MTLEWVSTCKQRAERYALEADLLIGDGLNHADRDHEEERNAKCDNERPHRHLRRPDLDADDAEHEHGHCARASQITDSQGQHTHRTSQRTTSRGPAGRRS